MQNGIKYDKSHDLWKEVIEYEQQLKGLQVLLSQANRERIENASQNRKRSHRLIEELVDNEFGEEDPKKSLKGSSSFNSLPDNVLTDSGCTSTETSTLSNESCMVLENESDENVIVQV
jgi:hypothetical protein